MAPKRIGMREASSYASNQQQQQNQHRSPQTSTTPAWDDRIAKDPIENSDSGVSPDHCTNNSSGSTRSSIGNSVLSPSSATSHDSIAVPSISYECSSPEEFTMHQDAANEEQEDLPVNSKQETNINTNLTKNPLECIICSFITSEKKKYVNHLIDHCSNDNNPELTQTVVQQLEAFQNEYPGYSGFYSQDHSERSKYLDSASLRFPRLNSQGKIKVSRCKQCSFLAITKTQYWKHTATHIREDKRLYCPKCNFVTEYRHHLEYHLHNHSGYKPFQCSVCSYACVNKSMLNSHMKSHSNIYQYTCKDCGYETKYCHSLKLHLRKYGHKPGKVLNADGTPNPELTIDIYGTRRGPKQKCKPNSRLRIPSEKKDLIIKPNSNNGNSNNITNNNNDNNNDNSTKYSIIDPAQSTPILYQTSTMGTVSNTDGITQNNHQLTVPYSYNQLIAAFNLSNQILHNENATSNEDLKITLGEYCLQGELQNHQTTYSNTIDINAPNTSYGAKNFVQSTLFKALNTQPDSQLNLQPNLELNPQSQLSAQSNPHSNLQSYPQLSAQLNLHPNPQQNTEPNLQSNLGSNLQSEIQENKLEAKKLDCLPLDLSKCEVTDQHQQPSTSSEDYRKLGAPKITGTRRRKGKAIKLAHRVIEMDTDDEMEQDDPIPYEHSAINFSSREPDPKNANVQDNGQSLGEEFTCSYCEIMFRNEIMYTLHMGYHGFNDPFTCNMCGHRCNNSISFFLHITKSNH